jgi:hypothetical protein
MKKKSKRCTRRTKDNTFRILHTCLPSTDIGYGHSEKSSEASLPRIMCTYSWQHWREQGEVRWRRSRTVKNCPRTISIHIKTNRRQTSDSVTSVNAPFFTIVDNAWPSAHRAMRPQSRSFRNHVPSPMVSLLQPRPSLPSSTRAAPCSSRFHLVVRRLPCSSNGTAGECEIRAVRLVHRGTSKVLME